MVGVCGGVVCAPRMCVCVCVWGVCVGVGVQGRVVYECSC